MRRALASLTHSIEPTLGNLAKLIFRLSDRSNDLPRRAWKLKHWLQRGYILGASVKEGTPHEINSPREILFMSELTTVEEHMPEERFHREWRTSE